MTSQSWFWPALVIVVALPVSLLVLTELHASLLRRGSSFARPVLLLRNYVLPVCALYLLITQVEHADVRATGSRIAATVFGFLVLLFLLSGGNAILFGRARSGSWRERLPAIFIDLGRLVLIVIGLALLFSWVWGADIGGLFAAVGVTSIVVGLAVQSAVGPVIAGLFLLFEQPFRIGDWLDTSSAKGRVVEVNWRAVHIDTGNGTQIVPNASLATDSFTNLSRIQGTAYHATATLTFTADDPPGAVRTALLAVADGLPAKLPGLPAKVSTVGEAKYKVSVPITGPAEEGRTKDQLLHRAWYASQRAGLHLDEATDQPARPEYLADRLTSLGASLGIDERAVAKMAPHSRRLLYAEGEVLQTADRIPDDLGFIAEGTVELAIAADDGRHVAIGRLESGDFVGATALTRQRTKVAAVALADTTIIAVARDAMDEVVRSDPLVARRIGEVVELRRRAAAEARRQAAATAV